MNVNPLLFNNVSHLAKSNDTKKDKNIENQESDNDKTEEQDI